MYECVLVRSSLMKRFDSLTAAMGVTEVECLLGGSGNPKYASSTFSLNIHLYAPVRIEQKFVLLFFFETKFEFGTFLRFPDP